MGKINKVAYINSFNIGNKTDEKFFYMLFLISYICKNDLEKQIIEDVFIRADIDIDSFSAFRRHLNAGKYKDKQVDFELPPPQKPTGMIKRFLIRLLYKLI